MASRGLVARPDLMCVLLLRALSVGSGSHQTIDMRLVRLRAG